MGGTSRNSFKIFLASVLRWQGDQECTKQLQGEAQEGDVVCQTQDSSVAEQQHLQTELQEKNDVGRAGQAGGECCKLDRQHVASIIDPDSERRRPSGVGIPEEPRQLELQAPLGHVTGNNPCEAAVPDPALLQPAPAEFVVGPAAGSQKLLDLQHKVSSQMVSQASLSSAGVPSQSSSVDLEAAKGQHTTIKQDVILRLEHLSPAEMKYTLWLLFVASLIGLVAVLTELSVKVTRDGSGTALNNLQQPVANMVFGIMCWVLLTANLCQIFSRVRRAHNLKKVWKRRRLVTCSLSILELIVQWVDATFFLVPNAYVLGNRCAYFSHVIVWGGFIRWSCWNTIFVVFLMHVHNAMPLSNQREAVSQEPPRNPHRSTMSSPVPADDTIVMDAPLAQWLRFHWPKYVLWAALEGLLLVIAMRFQVAGFAERLRHVPGSCDLSAYNCSQDSVQYALIIVAVCILLLYSLLFVALVTRVTHLLKNKPYTDYKISHKVLRLQTRTRGMVMLSSILCMVFLWWIFPSSCWGYMQTWLGFLPWQVTMTASCLIYSYIVMPIDPDAKAPILSAWLQELAWTEKEKPERLGTRNATLPDNEELRQAPMFCFETAIKMAYWSALVYDYKEAERTTLTLEDGSRLYNMQTHELYWERRHDTKCLMAWGDDAIVLAFRGTASFANARADLQAWRAPHPPARGNLWLGTKPLVHVGFLKSWVAGGLDQRVVGRVSELAQAASAAGTTLRIYVTGHSLGGALATLAAFDIARALQSADSASKHEVICYTFGAPRTGNHAFAQKYNSIVPDTWGLINDQDAVARTAKFVLLFKRPGQRVMINVKGDLIVRPSYAEANLQRTLAGHSVSDHLLSKYWQSLLTIVLNQFRCKRVRGGMRGVVRMAEESPALRQLFEEQLGMELGEMRRAARWANSHPSRVHLKNSHAPELAFYRKDRPSRDGRRSGSLGRSGTLNSSGTLGCGGGPEPCRSGSLGHSNSLGRSSSSPEGFAKSGQDASAVAPN